MEIVEIYKICKPYLSQIESVFDMVSSIYTVSTGKCNKLFKLLYGVDCPYIDDRLATISVITIALKQNLLDKFVVYIKETTHGNV